MDKKYAIFDMDGTLVESMFFWRGLSRELMESRGIDPNRFGKLKSMRHMTVLESAAVIVDHYKLDCTPQEAADELNERMAAHYRKDVELKPGVLAYLQKMRERGVKMYVASATDQPLMQACLERLGVLGYFEGIISCESVGVGKYEPDVYNAAAKALGSTPEETAVFEDSLSAGQTAKKAGYYLVGVYDESDKNLWPQMCQLADETIKDWTQA